MRQSDNDIAWTSQAGGKTTERFMLTERGLRRYLQTREADALALTVGHPGDCSQEIDLLAESELLEREDRYGIARTDRLTAAPQMFHVKRPFRVARDYGFAVQVEIPANPSAARAIRELDGRVVTLGGRGHRARVQFFETPLLAGDFQPAGPVDKAVYITPTPLADGTSSWPEGMSGVAERLQPVGGFDQGQRRPRPLRQALPAGAVVHGDRDGGSLSDITSRLCQLERPEPTVRDDDADEDLRLARAGFAWAVGRSSR